LADRNYQNQGLLPEYRARGLAVLAPPKHRRSEAVTWPRDLMQKRRRIETVFSQLAERYRSQQIWAREMWHLAFCWLRCVLSHTIVALLCQRTGLPPLQFGKLLIG
jgi:hypothetical protein